IDRLYQIYRFGFKSVFVTYITIIGRETRMRDPSLPPAYPFETPWHVGFFGALFAPEKSIFLFDPLLILMILLCVLLWRRSSSLSAVAAPADESAGGGVGAGTAVSSADTEPPWWGRAG